MKEIKLTRGKTAIVDDEDFEELSKHKWICSNWGYAVRSTARTCGKQAQIWMHVQIIGKIDGLEVDHINGDRLDNRRENLRHVTGSQNQYNRKPNKEGSSQYKGVRWHKRDKRWMSRIKIDGKSTHLGNYKAEGDAAMAYNEAAIRHFGEYAKLNTIVEG